MLIAYGTYLECDQKSDRFHGVITTIDIVAHKQIIGIWRLAANAKQFHQIMELTMNVATNRHRTLDFLNVGFFRQNLFGLKTNPEISDLTEKLGIGSCRSDLTEKLGFRFCRSELTEILRFRFFRIDLTEILRT